MKNTQQKIKVLAVFSLIDHAKEFYWYAKYIDKNKFHLECVFMNPVKENVQSEIESLGIICHLVKYKGKKNVVTAFFKLIRIIKMVKPDIVHTQLFDASLLGMLASKVSGISHRVSTRHHGDLHHRYHRQAVKYDRIINRLSEKIIVPSDEVFSILTEIERVDSLKIAVIKHGFDLDELLNVNEDEITRIKNENNIYGDPVIGVISRFTEWKGVQFTIKAFVKVLEKFPDAILVLSDTGGDYSENIKNELKSINNKNIRLVSFEKNVKSLFKTFDIFVHVPVGKQSESFGQVYIEALALGIPSVFTVSGILNSISSIEEYASVVPDSDYEAIFKSIIDIEAKKEIYIEKAKRGTEYIKNYFCFSEKMKKIEDLYISLLNG